MATCPPKKVIHEWIAHDLPLTIQMTITPRHIDQLLHRIEQYDNAVAFVDSLVEFKSQSKDATNDK